MSFQKCPLLVVLTGDWKMHPSANAPLFDFLMAATPQTSSGFWARLQSSLFWHVQKMGETAGSVWNSAPSVLLQWTVLGRGHNLYICLITQWEEWMQYYPVYFSSMWCFSSLCQMPAGKRKWQHCRESQRDLKATAFLLSWGWYFVTIFAIASKVLACSVPIQLFNPLSKAVWEAAHQYSRHTMTWGIWKGGLELFPF